MANESSEHSNAVKVVMGGVTYQVTPLTIRPSRAWREKFSEPFTAMAQVLAGAGAVELSDGAGLQQVIERLVKPLLNAPDLLLDMVCAYCPDIAADRARIEETAFDTETVSAFMQVLGLAYPFGALVGLLQAAWGQGAIKKQ